MKKKLRFLSTLSAVVFVLVVSASPALAANGNSNQNNNQNQNQNTNQNTNQNQNQNTNQNNGHDDNKPGNGFGDKNHVHSGPPGHSGRPDDGIRERNRQLRLLIQKFLEDLRNLFHIH